MRLSSPQGLVAPHAPLTTMGCMLNCAHMGIGVPKDITACRRFFAQPSHPRERMYEALRADFVEGRASHEVARAFGYSPGSFRVLCHQFRRDPNPEFFVSPTQGAREQPKKSKALDLTVALRKQNRSVYEISQALKERNLPLSPTAVREVLRAQGFAPLPRRLDEERPAQPGPTLEPVADVRGFELVSGTQFATRCGGLFLFLPELVRLQAQTLASAALGARLSGPRR
jgi:transposase